MAARPSMPSEAYESTESAESAESVDPAQSVESPGPVVASVVAHGRVLGTAFVIQPQLFITAPSVVAHRRSVRLRLASGEVPASVVFVNAEAGLAVLAVPEEQRYPWHPFASEPPTPGEASIVLSDGTSVEVTVVEAAAKSLLLQGRLPREAIGAPLMLHGRIGGVVTRVNTATSSAEAGHAMHDDPLLARLGWEGVLQLKLSGGLRDLLASARKSPRNMPLLDVLRVAPMGPPSNSSLAKLLEGLDKRQELFEEQENPIGYVGPGPSLLAVLLLARLFRDRLDGPDDFVSMRHVGAAILKLARTRPEQLELRPELVQCILANHRGFVDTVLEGARLKAADQVDTWRDILGDVTPRIASYAADVVTGDSAADKLGFGSDVRAMAHLIVSKQLTPPLSLALFGDWGSGKSFFMAQLERAVDELASATGAQNAAFKKDYWPNVFQVRFNAWQYADSNLWASLVSTIFGRLRKKRHPQESGEIEAARIAMLKEIAAAQVAVAAAKKREQAAVDAVTIAATELGIKRKAQEDAEVQAGKLRVHDVWAEVMGLVVAKDTGAPEGAIVVPERLRAQLNELGVAWDDALVSGSYLETRLAALTSPLGRIQAIVARSLTAPWWQIALAGLSVLLVLGLSTWAGVGEVLAVAGSLIAGLTAALTRLASASRNVTSLLDEAQKIEARLDAKVREREAEKRQKISEKEAEVSKLQDEALQASRAVEVAQGEVVAAKQDLADIEAGQLIVNFVQERAASDDYRKHLGLVSLVHRDFLALSCLVGEHNALQLSPRALEPNEPQPRDLGINRVVLYIDDLDRCPPKNVVEVLAAVHLLLAFPMFVVVVGVDYRWIQKSLRVHYEQTLVGGDGATPEDYLEKIFQIPYWLPPMAASDGEALVAAAVGKVTRRPGHTDIRQQPLQQSGASTTPLQRTGTESRVAVAGQPHQAPLAQPRVPTMEMFDDELESMSDVASLLTRSPRAAKRFVNSFRLIKAALDPEIGGLEPVQARTVILLLAVVTGAPAVFRNLLDNASSTGGSFVERLTAATNSAPEKERLRTLGVLASIEARKWVLDEDDIAHWVRRVAQFSFCEPPQEHLSAAQVPDGAGDQPDGLGSAFA